MNGVRAVALALALGAPLLALAQPDHADRHGDLLPKAARLRFGTYRLRQHVPDLHALSPDGKTLIALPGAPDERLRLWDTATGRIRHRVSGPTELINALALSADGTRLATAVQRGGVWLWDLAQRKTVGDRIGDDAPVVSAVAFSPDGTQLATGGRDGGVRIWDLRAGRLRHTLRGSHTTDVLAVAWAPDGRTVASADGAGRTVALWDAARGGLRAAVSVRDPATHLAFSPDGGLLGIGGPRATLLRLPARAAVALDPPVVGPIAFLPDGSGFLAVRAGQLCVSASRTFAVTRQLGVVGYVPTQVRVARDGSVASAGGPYGFGVWDLKTGRARFDGHTDAIRALAWSPDGGAFVSVAGRDGAPRLWGAADGAIRWTATDPRALGMGRAVAVRFGPAGRRVVTIHRHPPGADVVRLWDASSGRCLARWPLPAGTRVHHASLATDGSVAAVSLAGGTQLQTWRLGAGAPRPTTEGRLDVGRLPRAHVSGDGKLLLTHVGGALCLTRVPDGKTLHRWDPTHALYDDLTVAFGPRSRWLALLDNRADRVVLWDTARGAPFHDWPSGKLPVAALAISPDRRLVVGGTPHGPVVWEAQTGVVLARLKGSPVGALAISPDGRTLVTGGSYIDSAGLVWPLAPRPTRLTLAAARSALAGGDGPAVHAAVWALARAGAAAVPVLDELLRVRALDAAAVARHVEALGDAAFDRREAATAALRGLGPAVAPALRAAEKAAGDSPERLRRIRRLLAALAPPYRRLPSPAAARSRAIWALALNRSAAATDRLRRLVRDAPTAAERALSAEALAGR